MRYLDHDDNYKPFSCGKCYAELVFRDERDADGIGYVFISCPSCDDQRGFAFYGGRGKLDFGLLSEQAIPDCDFRVLT